MPLSFARETIERLRQPLVDDGHGNETPDPDLDHATVVSIPRCRAHPGSSQENLVGRDTTLIQWTVFAPPEVDVQADDLVRLRGIVFQVDGNPAEWPSPTGILAHTEILLKLWEG